MHDGDAQRHAALTARTIVAIILSAKMTPALVKEFVAFFRREICPLEKNGRGRTRWLMRKIWTDRYGHADGPVPVLEGLLDHALVSDWQGYETGGDPGEL